MATSGTRLGPYELISLIGAGGMGEVHKAHDARLNRTVAIKILKPDVATEDRLHRFEQEARSASGLNHPNILTIHDVGREGDVVYFAMEWVEGRTLREVIAGARLPIRRVVDLCHQIAEGLAKAHAAGIVHRDVKPENVMVSNDGFAKIVDFGLAKLTEAAAAVEGQTETRTVGTTPGLVMGTVGYMSPEQASGQPIDYRSDQFALGLLIYEMATRKKPFDRPTTAQSLAATIEAEPQPIEALNPEVPPHLAAVVARCLAKDPAERYESTRDLARDLRQILDAQSRTGTTVAAVPRRPRTRWLAAAIGTAVVAVAVGAWLWRPKPAASIEPQTPLVAVRAFRNLSADASQAYFVAGMTEEIRGQLSQVSALRLLSRNAVDRYGDGDVRRMASELGVGSIVEGSVRVAGNRVRIAVELIDASNQQTLWSEQYERELADVFAVQSDVALRIARALQANLSADQRQRLERRPTQNLEAYQLYLQSQQLVPLSDRSKNLAAIEVLRRALALDPAFATAQARLGYRLIFMGYYDNPSFIDQGIVEAEAALRQNPSLPAGHFALASAYSMKGYAARARLSFLRALDLDPNHTGSMNNLSIHEGLFGRYDEALHWGRRGFTLSGKGGNDYYHVAVPLSGLRDDDLTWRWLTDGERRFPDDARIQMMLAMMEVLLGRSGDAARRIETALKRAPANEELKMMRSEVAFLTDSTDLEAALEPLVRSSPDAVPSVVAETVRVRYAYALTKRGDSARGKALLADAERAARGRIEAGNEMPTWLVELAAVYALRRDDAAALEWLSRAFDAGYRDYGLLERDPIFAPLRGVERFRGVIDRMRRDVEAQRHRARERGLLDFPELTPAVRPF
ncbi:MAG: protein kinase domain-containing protein [Vicinamibacterales bacterium]